MRRYLTLAASAGLAALLCGSSPAWAQAVGNAQSFAIMGGTAVTANGIGSLITGDVGIAPAAGSFITGFPANATISPPFSNRGNDPTAIAARASIVTLNSSLISAAQTGANSLPELGGASFGPGVYNFPAQATLSAGNLTLTTPGLYIFKIGSFLTANTTTHVLLGAGVDPCNVFWQVTSVASLNGVNFVGNVVADAGVHLGTGATLTGRALATANGDVTLAGSGIVGGCSVPAAGTLPPTVTKAFSPASITPGGVSRLTITVSNPNAATISLTAAFTDTLPSGVLIAATPNPTTTCGGAVTATAGGSTVTLATGSTIPPGSCTIGVNVTAAAAGSFVNTIPAGALQTNNGNNAAPATAPLAAGLITLAPATLPNGTVGVPFSQTLTGSGGTAPFIFSVTAGALPTGVTLTPAGVLAGTPTTPGPFTFTIRGTDVNGAFGAQAFTTSITTAVPTLPQVFVLMLALGLTAVGYVRLRRRARPE
jgi:uncharacterized repeat protein (TIGR01451 family)